MLDPSPSLSHGKPPLWSFPGGGAPSRLNAMYRTITEPLQPSVDSLDIKLHRLDDACLFIVPWMPVLAAQSSD